MNFEKSADTKILESVLAEAKVGDMITYETLSKAIGRDVRVFALSSLGSARQGLLRSKNIVFGVKTNVGYLRLDDSQIIDSTEADRRRMKRAANRSIRKLSVVNFDNLPDDKKKQHIVASAQIGAISMFSSSNATKRITSKVNEGKTTLAIGETLSMFN